MQTINSAIILAGGKGERLRPHTNDKPKVMVEIGDKPMLEWVIQWLKSAGISNIVLATGYRSEVIRDKYRDGSRLGVKLTHSVEPIMLGTGGATKLALANKALKDDEDIVVVNGDILTDLNLLDMIKYHQSRKPLITMLAVPIASPWDIIKLNRSSQIVNYSDKPQLPYVINGGVYIFNKQAKDLLPNNGNQEETTFHKLSSEDFLAYKTSPFWRAVDTIKDKTEVEKNLNKLELRSK